MDCHRDSPLNDLAPSITKTSTIKANSPRLNFIILRTTVASNDHHNDRSSLERPFKELMNHRRRIKAEEKAKVVDSVWGGQNLFNFLATLAV